MVETDCRRNARHLEAEIDWFQRVVETRFRLHHGEPSPHRDVIDVTPPPLDGHSSVYKRFVDHFELSWQERLVLVLALVPHIQPYVLEGFLASIGNGGDGHGARATSAALAPTVETALFLLAGDDLETRFRWGRIFDPGSALVREQVLLIDTDGAPSAARNGAHLSVAPEYVSLFTSGLMVEPDFGEHFPARRIETRQNWDDLVLNPKTLAQIEEVKAWVRHGDTLLEEWGLGRKFAPGYTALFHGPPGTGKTMAANLLGAYAGLDVYLVDMALVVSRYVGDTSKNLGRIFDRARDKPWLLFFDECESVFSKRPETIKDAHDRWSGQEISYLLQRIETHPGVVILATNMKQHVDEAFLRRFESVVEFTMPTRGERLRIWKQGLSEASRLEDGFELEEIAHKYEMAPGTILNVIRYASLMALERGGNVIHREDVWRGIKREFVKEGRSL